MYNRNRMEVREDIVCGMWRKSYYVDGQLYMTVRENGTKMYYMYGKIHRVPSYEPAIVYGTGTKAWYFLGMLHRDGAPAIEWACGDRHWFHYGKKHRMSGPAVEKASGKKRWYIRFSIISKIYGVKYTEQEYSAIVFLKLQKTNESIGVLPYHQ